MTVEIIQAIGTNIVQPIVFGGVIVAYLWLILRHFK